MAYFLISVSNRTNLELCIEYALAGFTNSINGLWTFIEIQEEDYISFLYGAKVFNLYKVLKKEAIKNADKLPPWPSITFKMSGKTYYFPFRLYLQPLRKFIEPMVRPEFAYVAENLLLRGGYRKTHFQADQTTLQTVSQIGIIYNTPIKNLSLVNYETFTPFLTWNKNITSPPEIFYFQEFILQSLIRLWLSENKNLQFLLSSSNLNFLKPEDLEVLSEKALPEGHIDILVKERIPIGQSKKVVIEVKSGKAQQKDILQLKRYMTELGKECERGILIAQDFPEKVLKHAENNQICCFLYSFDEITRNEKYTIHELKSRLRLLLPKGR
jgi:hypothetical protein